MAAVGGLTAARKRTLNVVSGVYLCGRYGTEPRAGTLMQQNCLKVMAPKAELSDGLRHNWDIISKS
jgi:hypothetical protein